MTGRIRRGAVALGLALVAAGCGMGNGAEPVSVSAVFSDVGDLVVNHAVQVADVRVGKVTRIELTDDFQARVTMELNPEVSVPADSEAVLRQTSLLGEKFVELRPLGDDPQARPYLEDGGEIAQTREAPELEFVAEETIQILGGVAAQDLGILAETGAVAFGGRGEDLRSLLEDLSTTSSTLADQSTNIVSIIDGLDQLTQSLATNDESLDQMLVNLSETTGVLADNRDELVIMLESLTELARANDEVIFDPYLADVHRQVQQLDAIVAEVAAGRHEVAILLDWLNEFVLNVPIGVPGDFAQIYGWFNVCGTPTAHC